MIVDVPFLVAAAAFGWGLSLATYRLFAYRYDWPMGEPQSDRPIVPILIGVLAIAVAVAFAGSRGTDTGGWWILIAGLLWAVFWTGFLRVGSQVSLFLAPLASVVLLFAWAGITSLGDLGIATRVQSTGSITQPGYYSSEFERAEAERLRQLERTRAGTAASERRREDPEFTRR